MFQNLKVKYRLSSQTCTVDILLAFRKILCLSQIFLYLVQCVSFYFLLNVLNPLLFSALFIQCKVLQKYYIRSSIDTSIQSKLRVERAFKIYRQIDDVKVGLWLFVWTDSGILCGEY